MKYLLDLTRLYEQNKQTEEKKWNFLFKVESSLP